MSPNHRRLFWGVRLVSGIVLLGVGMFVLSYGSWWALPFLAGVGSGVLVGYRIYQATKPASDVGRRSRGPLTGHDG